MRCECVGVWEPILQPIGRPDRRILDLFHGYRPDAMGDSLDTGVNLLAGDYRAML